MRPGLGTVQIITESKSRTEAILRATFGVSPECSLQGLEWLKLGLLPQNNLIFAAFEGLLGRLAAEGGVNLEQILEDFRRKCVEWK